MPMFDLQNLRCQNTDRARTVSLLISQEMDIHVHTFINMLFFSENQGSEETKVVSVYSGLDDTRLKGTSKINKILMSTFLSSYANLRQDRQCHKHLHIHSQLILTSLAHKLLTHCVLPFIQVRNSYLPYFHGYKHFCS